MQKKEEMNAGREALTLQETQQIALEIQGGADTAGDAADRAGDPAHGGRDL